MTKTLKMLLAATFLSTSAGLAAAQTAQPSDETVQGELEVTTPAAPDSFEVMGDMEVTTVDGETMQLGAGDRVVFGPNPATEGDTNLDGQVDVTPTPAEIAGTEVELMADAEFRGADGEMRQATAGERVWVMGETDADVTTGTTPRTGATDIEGDTDGQGEIDVNPLQTN